MEEILVQFQEKAWGMLLAQMQTGKTNTFLLTACEMLRTGKVERVIIFSGNQETDLRDQLNEKKKDIKKTYRKFLRDQRGVTADEADEGDNIVDKITIHFGQDLKQCNTQTNTFYIWEESHYGQSQKQQVDMFLRRMGIQATGVLPEGCFFLSVSATPFSELSDLFHMSQAKFVVRLIPSDEYLSVKKMMENGQIRNMKDPVKELATILRPVKDGYVLIRASETHQAKLSSIAIAAGFEVVQCDMTHKFDLNTVLRCPAKKTVIFLKGMCRMGKQVVKTHVRLVMETSSGKTDTLLQSLLGRMCGYNSRSDILIYVKNLNLDELEKYNILHEGVLTSIPSKAMNVVHSSKTRKPIKPIRITLGEDSDECNAVNVLEHLDHLEHQNSEEDMEIALPIIRRICEEVQRGDSSHWKSHGKRRAFSKNKIYNKNLPLVEKAWREGLFQCKFGYGAGADDGSDEIVVWETDRYLYIVMQIEREHQVPVTTEREVFCRETTDGGAIFRVSPLTRKDPAELEKTVDAFIEASRELDVPVLTSNGYGEYMLFTEKVMTHLETILKKWKKQGVTITVKKVTGRKPAGLTDIRVAEITWTKPPQMATIADHLLVQ